MNKHDFVYGAQDKRETPQTSWWVGVSREDWREIQAKAQERMAPGAGALDYRHPDKTADD